MKNCLNCNTEFRPKREHAKFCSDKCRVAYNRNHPAGSVTKTQLQVLYNAFLEAIGKIQYSDQKIAYDSPKKPAIQDEPLKIVQPKPALPRVAIEAIKRKYVEDRRECTCDEEFIAWFEKLESDERLNQRDKNEVKNTI